MDGFVLILVIPCILTFASAFIAGRALKCRLKAFPTAIRFIIANLTPIGCLVGYFAAFQWIDFGLHQRAGGDSSNYMGPMTALIYGAPLFGLVLLISAFLASYRFAES